MPESTQIKFTITFIDDATLDLELRMEDTPEGPGAWSMVVPDTDTRYPLNRDRIRKAKQPLTEVAAKVAETHANKRAEQFAMTAVSSDPTKEPKTLDGYFNLEYPTNARMARSFTDATARWWKAGRPTRTDEEVDDILENKCKPCKYYDDTKNKPRCKICGCALQKSGIVSKLKMKTESEE